MSTDRYPHRFEADGLKLTGSGKCRDCTVSDESEGSDQECPIRLRTVFTEVFTEIRVILENHGVTSEEYDTLPQGVTLALHQLEGLPEGRLEAASDEIKRLHLNAQRRETFCRRREDSLRRAERERYEARADALKAWTLLGRARGALYDNVGPKERATILGATAWPDPPEYLIKAHLAGAAPESDSLPAEEDPDAGGCEAGACPYEITHGHFCKLQAGHEGKCQFDSPVDLDDGEDGEESSDENMSVEEFKSRVRAISERHLASTMRVLAMWPMSFPVPVEELPDPRDTVVKMAQLLFDDDGEPLGPDPMLALRNALTALDRTQEPSCSLCNDTGLYTACCRPHRCDCGAWERRNDQRPKAAGEETKS